MKRDLGFNNTSSAIPEAIGDVLGEKRWRWLPGQPKTGARDIAFHTLLAVEKGEYASDLLAAATLGLASRDAGLASEIVFGVLRYQTQLDFLIEHYSGRAGGRLDPEVRIALRMGIYQLRHLDRVPAHAAINESVELVKQARKRSAAGFVNALLRKVNREPVAWPDRAVELSHPAWMLERCKTQFGAGTAEGIARANLAVPRMYIHVPPGATPPPGAVATEITGCFHLIEGKATGFRIQDIGSQAIVPLLRLEQGQSFLDLCAAPGNKTAQALESRVRAVACDLHPRRLALLKRLEIGLVALDAARPLPFRRRFDRILVDAPCSGTGTLARNPEIKWRLRNFDIEQLHDLQVKLLGQARQALAPDGLLVYATCSLEREENEQVVETVPPELVVETMRRIPGHHAGDGFFAAVIKSV